LASVAIGPRTSDAAVHRSIRQKLLRQMSSDHSYASLAADIA
jgi:hypothetical protein